MAESRDWAAVCIAPVIRRETSSPFQVVPVHKESPGRITASFELKILLLVATVALSACNGSIPGISGPWRALEPFTSVSLGGVAYGPQGFVAVGGTGFEGRIFVSP